MQNVKQTKQPIKQQSHNLHPTLTKQAKTANQSASTTAKPQSKNTKPNPPKTQNDNPQPKPKTQINKSQ